MTDDDHGGGRADNSYCKHCADAMGNLKSREEVREGMIAFYQQSMGKTREEAEKEVDTHMAQMPAWASGGQTPTAAEPTAPAAPEPVPGSAPMASGPSVAEPGPSAAEPEPVISAEPTPPPVPASEPPPAPESAQETSVPAEPGPGIEPPAPTETGTDEPGAGGQIS